MLEDVWRKRLTSVMRLALASRIPELEKLLIEMDGETPNETTYSNTSAVLMFLASSYEDAGELDKASALHDRRAAITLQVARDATESAGISLAVAAQLQFKLGRTEKGEELARRAMELYSRIGICDSILLTAIQLWDQAERAKDAAAESSED